jgi:predicted RNA-binding protein YlxR (DUF448 family)
VTLDETGRLAGRGAYVCRDEACRTKAASRGILGRALGVAVPTEVRAALEGAMMTTMKMTTNDEGGVGGQE